MTINWDRFQSNFMDFLRHVTIVSKDEGRIRLEMYDAQRYFFDEVFDGLRNDQHYFVVGKARQLGITTACYLFDMFYAGAIDDVQAGIVFDTHDNKEVFRTLFRESIEALPPSHRLPIRGGHDNRNNMVFTNGNMIQYLIAGVKRGQGSIGRSRALNFCHMSELSYYGDPEAFAAFKNTFSNVFPYRCYIAESTGRGYGLLYDEWMDAVADTIEKRPIFVAWWRKRTYSYPKGSPLYDKYGWKGLSKEEAAMATEVSKLYTYLITDEQWAWYRHNSDPRAQAEGADTLAGERHEVFTQEHPTTPDQLFRGTGSPFISGQFIVPAEERASRALFKAYTYYIGDDITATRIEQTRHINRAQLKVWEEPRAGGTYVIGADSAYGISDTGDNFCAQVLRCYSDRLVQVAEFCDPSVQSYQFAWVMIHLCGWYENCRYAIELNGSGEAVWTEMKNMRRAMEDGSLVRSMPPTDSEEELQMRQSWRYMLGKVRQYYYHRPDSIGGGINYHWKTTLESKFTMMVQMSDRFILKQLDINSIRCLEEMRSLRKDGRMIEAEGQSKKDDRPMALALAVRCYMDGERSGLVARNASYEMETARDAAAGESADMGIRFMSGIMAREWQQKAETRKWQRRTRSDRRWQW